MGSKSDDFVSLVFQSMNDTAQDFGYLSSAYKIGTAILAHKEAEKIAIKNNLVPQQIERLWSTIDGVEASQLAIDPNRSRLEACQNWIASEIDLLEHIGQFALIKLGQKNEQYTRKVLIILIKNYLNNKAAFVGFNYAGLNAGSIEQTAQSVVWPAIAKCDHLPVELIKKLGEKDSKIAKNILRDIEPYHNKKEISDYFHKIHAWPEPHLPSLNSKTLSETTTQPESSFLGFMYRKLKYLLSNLQSGLSSFFKRLPQAPVVKPILTLYHLHCAKKASDRTQNLDSVAKTSFKTNK